ncbi:MAG: PQQ-binding-like beta-propeller repeat protein [Candidatus Bathyarchaeota archaeon]|nr:PQQ-binding-like beta-propeller repeat protein [Candidatus Bathyarchaeota archaeon]
MHTNNSLKKLLSSAILILLIASSIFAATSSLVTAHTPPWEIPTYLYITAAPNPVGVGQQITIVFWINWLPPTAAGSAGDRWYYFLDITKPDNTKQTVGPLISDPVGGSYYIYTPEATGNYSVTARFGPQVLTGSNGTGIMGTSTSLYINDTFKASSGTTTFTVQEEPLPSPPLYPLPTEYWTRPIEGQNDNWYIIASQWLGPQQALRFQPDGTAPSSAHVMWTKPIEDGGVVGGTNTGTDGMTFYDGTAYEGRFGAPLVVNGRLYYAVPKSNSATAGGFACVDLRTGKDIFWQNITMPTFGQLYDYESFNQHGVIPNGYLWRVSGTNWSAYDSLTGNWLFDLYNCPSGAGSAASWGVSTIYGPNGEILFYQLNSTANWLALWNNTAAQALTGSINPNDYTSSSYFQWRPIGKTVDMSKSYSWNVTIPKLPGTTNTIVRVFPDDIMLGTSTSFAGITTYGTPDPWTMWAISLKPESRGQLLWSQNYPAPSGNQTVLLGPVDETNRVFTIWLRDGLTFTGYSLDDGKQLWTSEREDDWGFYSSGWAVAYGKLIHSGYGTVYCYDTKDGRTLWKFSVPSGLSTPYTNYPLGIQVVADGKVFLGTNEHSRNAPYWKGSKVYCLNATTGDLIWSLDAATPSSAGGIGQVTNGFAIADGYYTYLNLYDHQIYTIGKGPSALSVTASPKVSVQGSSVLVEGNVLDIASGTTQPEQKARFPSGVPAVSDESMSDWMAYVYMQKPKPTDVTGVTVKLSVIDNNGNYRDIGTATSDSSGSFSFKWTPDIPGKYIVIATFEGSESYWPSQSETAIVVDEAAPTQAPTPAPTSVADTYFIPAIAGLFALNIIIAIVLVVLMLRRRP